MPPYDPPLIARLLRGMDDAALAAVTPRAFQTAPVVIVTKAAIIQELVANEQAKRRAAR